MLWRIVSPIVTVSPDHQAQWSLAVWTESPAAVLPISSESLPPGGWNLAPNGSKNETESTSGFSQTHVDVFQEFYGVYPWKSIIFLCIGKPIKVPWFIPYLFFQNLHLTTMKIMLVGGMAEPDRSKQWPPSKNPKCHDAYRVWDSLSGFLKSTKNTSSIIQCN